MAQERTKMVTPPFRVSFPEIFEKAQYGEGVPKYSVTMLFYPGKMNDKEKEALRAMKAMLDEATRGKFGKPVSEMPANFKKGIRDGKEKADLDGYGDGCIFAKASSKTRPGLIDKDRQPILAEEDFYPGCWARATIVAYAYDNKSKGVAFGLNNLQKLGDDESFASRVAAEDDFDDDASTVWDEGDAAPPAAADDDFLS